MVRGLVILVLFATSCAESTHSPFEPGDRVVAPWRDAFWVATVIAVQGKLVTVAWDTPPPERSYFRFDSLSKLDSPVKTARDQQWLLCPTGAEFRLCQVKSVKGSAVHAVSAAEGEIEMDLSELLPVPAGLERAAARQGAAELLAARAIEQVGRIVPDSAGQSPSEGQPVVARWTDGSWWSAVARWATEEKITVAWDDGSAPTDLSPSDVAPRSPPSRPSASGDLALCSTSATTRLNRAVVVASRGATLDVSLEDGTRSHARASECVLGRAPK